MICKFKFIFLTCIVATLLKGTPLHAGEPYKLDDIYKDDVTVELVQALARDDSKAVDSLLKQGADINKKGRIDLRPIHVLSLNRHIAGIRLAGEKGANMDVLTTDGSTPLFAALLDPDSFPIIKALVESGASVKFANHHSNITRGYPIGALVMKEAYDDSLIYHLNLAEPYWWYLNNGGSVNEFDMNGNTPLTDSYNTRSFEFCLELLKRGANPHFRGGNDSMTDKLDNGHFATPVLDGERGWLKQLRTKLNSLRHDKKLITEAKALDLEFEKTRNKFEKLHDVQPSLELDEISRIIEAIRQSIGKSSSEDAKSHGATPR